MTVARLALRGHGAQSDAPMDQVQWHVSEWRDGKTIWWHVFVDESEALEAAGLRASR